MPARIVITSVAFSFVPATNQTCSLYYKLQSDPESAFTLVSNNVDVQPDGTLTSPVTIGGLLFNTVYTVRCLNNCNGNVFDKDFDTAQATTTTTAAPTTTTSTTTVEPTTTTSTTTAAPTTSTTTAPCADIPVNYSFTAPGVGYGAFKITVNGIEVVNVNDTTSSFILVQPGDLVHAFLTGVGTNPLTLVTTHEPDGTIGEQAGDTLLEFEFTAQCGEPYFWTATVEGTSTTTAAPTTTTSTTTVNNCPDITDIEGTVEEDNPD